MTHETHRWYQPQDVRSAVDAIENCKAIIRFLCDTLSQEGFKPGSLYSLSEEGANGLYLIYGFIEDILDDCINLLCKGVK